MLVINLILIKCPAYGLDYTTSNSDKKYSLNFTEQQNKLCLVLHYNRTKSYIFVDGVEICKFKPKDSEINAALLHLGNV